VAIQVNIKDIIKKSIDRGLEESDIAAFCTRNSCSKEDFFDQFSRAVAEGYHHNEMSFSYCDGAMNTLVALANYDVPTFSWSVFLAFDEGEYQHHDDSPEVDPAQIYTRPRIAEILSKGV
jgi:hypothetical protein